MGHRAWPLIFFSDLRSVCVALPSVAIIVVPRRSSSTPPKDEVVVAPPKAAAMLVIQPPLPVSPPLQAVASHAAGPRQAGARFASALPAVLARTSLPMFLKEDVVATPDLSATVAATCAVDTPT